MKKRALGRNLDVLLSRTKPAAEKQNQENTVASPSPSSDGLQYLTATQLQRGRYQPRKEIPPETIRELADSIKSQGVIQPIIVRKISTDNYEIIAGERRWRAAQLVGLTEVPVIIKDIPDESALAMALIENIQRENLNAIEEAIALQRLIDEFGMTHQQVASSVGKSRTTVTNLLRLLGLKPEVKLLLETGQLEMGHARALLTLEDAQQIYLAQKVVQEGLSVRDTEQFAMRLQQTKNKSVEPKIIDGDLQRLQQKVSLQLGATVKLNHNRKGKGKMTIQYNNLKELDKILVRIAETSE